MSAGASIAHEPSAPALCQLLEVTYLRVCDVIENRRNPG